MTRKIKAKKITSDPLAKGKSITCFPRWLALLSRKEAQEYHSWASFF